MASGELVVFDGVKGYGFVQPDSGGDDIFVHVNDLLFDKHRLVVGSRLVFDVDEGDRGQKASNVKLEHEDCSSPAPDRPSGPTERVSSAESRRQLQNELTEALLARVPSLTSEQLLQVRATVMEIVGD